MEPYEGWLSRDEVKCKSEDVVKLIRKHIQERDYAISTTQATIADVMIDRQIAFRGILSEWFFSSVGVEIDSEAETFFLSKSPNAYMFVQYHVVPWTNWLGDLYNQVKNALIDGSHPVALVYGPPKDRSLRPVGPMAEYQFKDGSIKDFQYYFRDSPKDIEVGFAQSEVEQDRFGLNQIISTIDAPQNEQIRLESRGVFAFIGGPGVGKTTVALHRLVFLINEQYDESGKLISNPEKLFFSQDNSMILVWKEHLVPYLRSCINELGLQDFPEENVSHVEAWINQTIRNYIPIGPRAQEYKFGGIEAETTLFLKRNLDEKDLLTFLRTECEQVRESFEMLSDLYDSTVAFLSTRRLSVRGNFTIRPNEIFSADEVVSLRDELLGSIEKVQSSNSPKIDTTARLGEEVRRVCDKVLDRLADFVSILRGFYLSDVVSSKLNLDNTAAQAFSSDITKQLKQSRRLTPTDTHFVLWIIRYITGANKSVLLRHKSMPLFSHIIVDEAQYYEPIVLRLLSDLCQIPKGVLTIVGDLEQKISKLGSGLTSWDQVGLTIPSENIRRLGVNYRSSRRVIEFLAVFRSCVAINEILEMPRKFRSEGTTPEISTHSDRNSEFESIADSIHEMKQLTSRRPRSIVVVIPDSLQNAADEYLIKPLADYGINARWATGLDVKESVDQVIVTDRNSVVGLEFDAVFYACADQSLTSLQNRDDIQAAWVAISRAKDFLRISRVGIDAVFDLADFAQYRVAK
jgi:hypothetical protein